MSLPTFIDTHKYIKKLKAAGVSEEQAEVYVHTLVDIVNNGNITNTDFQQPEVPLARPNSTQGDSELSRDDARRHIERDLNDIQRTLLSEILAVERRITHRVALMIAGAALILALLIVFF
ncbi:MAG: hypothetical protein ACLGPL_09415 [Acidobacteriota bacterium]